MEMDKQSGREEGLNWVLKDKQEIWDLGKKSRGENVPGRKKLTCKDTEAILWNSEQLQVICC